MYRPLVFEDQDTMKTRSIVLSFVSRLALRSTRSRLVKAQPHQLGLDGSRNGYACHTMLLWRHGLES